MKLMWCSDNLKLPTGYAQVTRNLLSRFKIAGVDIQHLSFHIAHPLMEVPSQMPIDYPILYPTAFDEFYGNKDSIALHTVQQKPDLLCLLGDHFMFKWMLDDKILDGKIIKKYQEIKRS